MSDENRDDESLEVRLRRLAQQLGQSVEHLEELDLSLLARMTGIDADRAKEFLHSAGEWLNSQADDVVSDAVVRFGGLIEAVSGNPSAPASTGPHPLDLPTPGQGLALSAIDSGRWTVEPGSHVLLANGEGPAPDDALGLVGELRARDWINGDGEITLIGQNALKRWAEQSNAS